MDRAWLPAIVATLLLAAAAPRALLTQSLAQTPDRLASRPAVAVSGTAFQSPATQAIQADDGANPAMLWVEQGEQLWKSPAGPGNKACATCHGDATQSMKGVAAHFPKFVSGSGALLNLEGRINACRSQHQHTPEYAYESQPLLSLTAYITFQSRGLPRDVAIDGLAAPYFERGRSFYMTRQGQLNLACAQCHDDNAGRKLRGDTISQGQTLGWPGYRLEWQTMGSLHRRLRACSLGVRAEILDAGSPEYTALELYLAWRSKDLPIDAPGVRR